MTPPHFSKKRKRPIQPHPSKKRIHVVIVDDEHEKNSKDTLPPAASILNDETLVNNISKPGASAADWDWESTRKRKRRNLGAIRRDLDHANEIERHGGDSTRKKERRSGGGKMRGGSVAMHCSTHGAVPNSPLRPGNAKQESLSNMPPRHLDVRDSTPLSPIDGALTQSSSSQISAKKRLPPIITSPATSVTPSFSSPYSPSNVHHQSLNRLTDHELYFAHLLNLSNDHQGRIRSDHSPSRPQSNVLFRHPQRNAEVIVIDVEEEEYASEGQLSATTTSTIQHSYPPASTSLVDSTEDHDAHAVHEMLTPSLLVEGTRQAIEPDHPSEANYTALGEIPGVEMRSNVAMEDDWEEELPELVSMHRETENNENQDTIPLKQHPHDTNDPFLDECMMDTEMVVSSEEEEEPEMRKIEIPVITPLSVFSNVELARLRKVIHTRNAS